MSVSPKRQAVGKMKITQIMYRSRYVEELSLLWDISYLPSSVSSAAPEILCTWTRNFLTNITCFISELWFL